MKTKILRKTVVSGFVLLGLAVLLTAGTRDGKGLVRTGNALPANVIVVTNTKDSGPGSLRDALATANDGDTIDATGISGTILLTSGELQINHNVTINGPGAGSLAVNGNATSRIFENFGSNVTISGFTITAGFAADDADDNGGGGILNHGGLILGESIVSNCAAGGSNQQGGGISSPDGATLTVTGSTITGNGAGSEGGGIYSSDAQLTVINSIISSNGAGAGLHGAGSGGGIFYSGGGTVNVTNSVISGNLTNHGGGGMTLGEGTATVVVTDCTISDNLTIYEYCTWCTGPGGGGILNTGSLTVINSTISGNEAAGGRGWHGGGIDNGGNLTLTNSTLSENRASGGTVYNGGTITIEDTVLNAGDGRTIFNDGGGVTSHGYNIASDDGSGVLTGPGDQINTDPMLGPLQDNGGSTFTHALLPGSPAINAGNPSFTPPPFFDQRGLGFHRVVNGRIDIGSFEIQSAPTPTPTPTVTPTPTPTATPTPRATPTPKPRPSRPPRLTM